MKSHCEVSINAPVEAVWDLVNDIPKWADIMGRENPSQVQHWENGAPFGYNWTARVGGTTVKGESRFPKFEPPKRLVEESVTPVFRGAWTLTLEGKETSGTRASLDLTARAESGMLNWFFWLPRSWALRSQAAERLAILKARAEGQAQQPPARTPRGQSERGKAPTRGPRAKP